MRQGVKEKIFNKGWEVLEGEAGNTAIPLLPVPRVKKGSIPGADGNMFLRPSFGRGPARMSGERDSPKFGAHF